MAKDKNQWQAQTTKPEEMQMAHRGREDEQKTYHYLNLNFSGMIISVTSIKSNPTAIEELSAEIIGWRTWPWAWWRLGFCKCRVMWGAVEKSGQNSGRGCMPGCHLDHCKKCKTAYQSEEALHMKIVVLKKDLGRHWSK
ncbi:hypothetical protein BT96DRAFT_951361 [Gymnopus androsaceus JB14]|uniref:Uncharacterized protein n=1 Tax=Gymnopus androsaceus JB14 TaxID=1447944 RepID=A0A6A4GDE5_9AGAR|nr:hypothetical protein BT96DRAFT_951361 [Gymnopus androsaceus JB14]